MRILITGAAGRVGSAVATHFQNAGYDLVATDAAYRPELGFKLHLVDLLDLRAIYPLVEGCDAVIQLGNHPNAHATKPAQKLLAENVAMNANVFYAALDVGVRRIVGISSIQAMSGRHSHQLSTQGSHRCRFPHFPIDGRMPRQPGNNEYALSKVFAEQTLEAMADEHDDLAAVAVRLPGVLRQDIQPNRRYEQPLKLPDDPRLLEAACYVRPEDVCTALRAIVEHSKPGYHQYFVGQSLVVRGMSTQDLVARAFPDRQVLGPLGGDGGMVDLSALKRDLDWSPAQPPVEVDWVESDESPSD